MRNIRTLGVVISAGALAATGVSVGTASAGAATHTLRLTAVQLAKIQTGSHEVTASKDIQNGKATGTDVVTCVANVNTHNANCDAAVARRRGLIYAHVTVALATGKGSGKITGGTRAFKSATGTIAVSPGSRQNTTKVTLVYR